MIKNIWKKNIKIIRIKKIIFAPRLFKISLHHNQDYEVGQIFF